MLLLFWVMKFQDVFDSASLSHQMEFIQTYGGRLDAWTIQMVPTLARKSKVHYCRRALSSNISRLFGEKDGKSLISR
jgi:hypothetical protein